MMLPPHESLQQHMHTDVPDGHMSGPGMMPQRGVDSLGMVLRGKWLILLATSTALGLAYWKFLNDEPQYRSSARVLVVQHGTDLPVEGLDVKGDYRHNIDTQIALIQSRRIIKPAVAELDLDKLLSISDSNAVGTIQRGLDVQQGANGRSQILLMSYTGSNPRECRQILKAVIGSYREFLNRSHEQLSQETLTLIRRAKDVVLRDLNRAKEMYNTLRAENPGIWREDVNVTVHRDRLMQIERARSPLFLQRADLDAEIESIETALKTGGHREAIWLMVGKLSQKTRDGASGPPNSDDPLSVEMTILPLLIERTLLLDQVGPDHPRIKRLDRKMEVIRSHSASLDGVTPRPLKKMDFVQIYIDSLRQRIKAIETKEAKLNELYEQQQQAARSVAEFEVKDAALRDEITRLSELFAVIVEKLDDLDLAKEHGRYSAEEIDAPSYGSQISPNFPRIMTIGGVIGLLVGFVLAYLREKADRRFLAPEDIHTELGIPVVGHIGDMARSLTRIRRNDTNDSRIDPIVITYHRPQSRGAEAFRAVRVSLYFSTQAAGLKVIQITSPNPGDGKSTLAMNLAVSIANSRKKVLLLEADFRRPRVHRMLGAHNEHGIVEVLKGTAELSDALQTTEIANLDCLTCGNKPSNPAELLTAHQFEDLLEVARERYDFVILDTPPLLAVTDPSVVAPRVDGVFVIMRLRKSSRVTATRAVEVLYSVGANVLGIVVNGMGASQRYGYGEYGQYGAYRSQGYGHYNSYGYGYGYGYGEGYGGREAGRYYTDERSGTKREGTALPSTSGGDA